MPGLPVVLYPDAVDEAQAARIWYAERSQSAADSFLAEFDHGIVSISEAPERCRYLYRALAAIYSAGFRSRSSIESPTIALR